MVSITRTQPAPESLKNEKAKANGSYLTPEVISQVRQDFMDKCYICELKSPESINVEHFKPHKGNLDLKFDWNNLFWACAHCNNTKLAKYDNILNCTVESDLTEESLRLTMTPIPFAKVVVDSTNQRKKTLETQDLLSAVYNGTTPLKKVESENLRNMIAKELMQFNALLIDYYLNAETKEIRDFFSMKIRSHLHRGTSFSSFKRWIIRDNPTLLNDFGSALD